MELGLFSGGLSDVTILFYTPTTYEPTTLNQGITFRIPLGQPLSWSAPVNTGIQKPPPLRLSYTPCGVYQTAYQYTSPVSCRRLTRSPTSPGSIRQRPAPPLRIWRVSLFFFNWSGALNLSPPGISLFCLFLFVMCSIRTANTPLVNLLRMRDFSLSIGGTDRSQTTLAPVPI